MQLLSLQGMLLLAWFPSGERYRLRSGPQALRLEDRPLDLRQQQSEEVAKFLHRKARVVKENTIPANDESFLKEFRVLFLKPGNYLVSELLNEPNQFIYIRL